MIAAAGWYFHSHSIAVLQPSGSVGQKERNLIFIALLLAVLVVVPVYVMTIVIALKYRETNPKSHAKYRPDWDHSRAIEFTWWAIPGVIITVLSIITWNSAHALDPFKPLNSNIKPLKIEVVSLDWKWLFIYPDQKIATVNYLRIPTNVPIDFHVTSDSVMNSFWVPALGGQIYSMPGMDTQINLLADKAGNFGGSSANISGVGFADMTFRVQATSQTDFNHWVNNLRSSPDQLNQAAYSHLAKPSQKNPVVYYSHVENGLYDNIVLKYAAPSIRLHAQLQAESQTGESGL